MSEFVNTRRADLRWQLLSTVSAATLIVCVAAAPAARADDTDRPVLWIELGGQLERITGGEDPFLPPFALQSPTPEPFLPISPTEAQKSPIYSYGFEGEFSFRPHATDWTFTAGVPLWPLQQQQACTSAIRGKFTTSQPFSARNNRCAAIFYVS